MRLLHRRRLDHHILEMPVFAVVREPAVAGPRLAQEGDRLLVALLGFLHRDAEAVKLAPAIALADAEIESAVGQQVQGRGLFGQQRRVVPRHHQHGRAEPQLLCLGGEIGEEIQRRRDLAEPGEMVLDQEHAVIAELLGLADVIDVVAVDLAVARLVAQLGARAAEQPEPHPALLLTDTSSERTQQSPAPLPIEGRLLCRPVPRNGAVNSRSNLPRLRSTATPRMDESGDAASAGRTAWRGRPSAIAAS